MSKLKLLVIVCVTGVVVVGVFAYFFIVPKVHQTVTVLSHPSVAPFGTPPSSASQTPSQPSVPATQAVVNSDNTAKNCGTDFDCFIAAGQTCTPATVESSVTVDIFGLNETTADNMSIQGPGPNGGCISRSRVDVITLAYDANVKAQAQSQGVSDADMEAQLAQSQTQANQGIGMTTTCSFQSTSILVKALNEEKLGDSSISDNANCSTVDANGQPVSMQ